MQSTEDTTLAKLEPMDYSIMDKQDEEQIINATDELKQALVYEIDKGKKGKAFELSYVGLKHLTLLMSQGGQSLEILDYKMELLGDKPEEKVWYATVKVRNQKTKHESLGMSEQPYYFQGKYDPFGRTKALSKAERNAWRKQIPELEIKKLITDAQAKGQVQTIDKSKTLDKFCDCKLGTNFVDLTVTPPKCRTCGGIVKT